MHFFKSVFLNVLDQTVDNYAYKVDALENLIQLRDRLVQVPIIETSQKILGKPMMQAGKWLLVRAYPGPLGDFFAYKSL